MNNNKTPFGHSFARVTGSVIFIVSVFVALLNLFGACQAVWTILFEDVDGIVMEAFGIGLVNWSLVAFHVVFVAMAVAVAVSQFIFIKHVNKEERSNKTNA